jgi:NAD(P)-dependent dehydrogenase (short-subunit alcohol dehydrogenase family)
MNANNGKLAVITGGASPPGDIKGIGRATAALLKENGYTVVVGDIDEEAGKETAKELGVTYLYTDVRSYETMRTFIASALSLTRASHIDVLIAGAGENDGSATRETPPKAWDNCIQLNLTGAYNLVYAALPHLSGGARIIFLASLVGLVGQRKNSAYTAAKAGLIGYAKSLALELAPQRITVNVICPHATRTPMFFRWGKTQPGGAEEAEKTMAANIPLGRLINPEEIAGAALFLASPAAAMMTGQAIVMDGGYSLG